MYEFNYDAVKFFLFTIVIGFGDVLGLIETQETERTDLERNLKSAEAKASDLETKFADMSAKYEDAEAQRQKGKVALDRVQAELSTWNKEESEELIASLKKEKFQRDLELEELRLENAKLKKQIEINSGASVTRLLFFHIY